MPRQARQAPGGFAYHVLNRANGRLRLFKKDLDYVAFERTMLEAFERVPIRVLDWCVMPNHWHFVLWPKEDDDVTRFMRWLTLTHAQRWKHAHDAVGHGHLYQGRFRSFPIQQDEHLLTVLRYVERNPVRPGMADRAEEWRWGSCFVRQSRAHSLRGMLADWPVDRPRSWLELVNAPLSASEHARVKEHIERNRPYGGLEWMQRTAKAMDLEQSLRPRGRPFGWRKRPEAAKMERERK